MDYEQKYKDALERAKNLIALYPQDAPGYREVFPELAESEDERIRKVIYKLMLGMREEIFTSQDENVTKEKVLAYLEKQKEQIPYTDFVIKPHNGDDNNPYDMRVSEAQEYAIKRGFGVPFNDGEVYVDERHMTQTIGNILRWADEHPKEQKPWKVGENAYFTPEQKQEWSEEDEKYLNRVINLWVNDFGEDSDTVKWLKSLRPSWKPSEEQPDVDIREEIKKLEFMGSNDARDILHVAEHFYELGKQSKEPVSHDLEEAAVRWEPKYGIQVSELINRDIRNAFIAGGELQKGQMMKEAVEGYITFNRDAQEEGLPCVTVIANEKPIEFYESRGFKLGDNVKIIIVKQ